jgi:tripartite-type tricarboxylate transporter receptor subunit TctC
MVDVAAGHADIAIGSVLSSLPLIKGGKLKALAVTGSRRQAAMPQVPTVAEAGLPGYAADNWWGVLAPAGTPAEIVARLDKTIAELLATPEARKYFGDESAEIAYQNREEFGRFLAADTLRWSHLIKQSGITLD